MVQRSVFHFPWCLGHVRCDPCRCHDGRNREGDYSRPEEREKLMIVVICIMVVLLLCASWLKAASDDDDHAGRG